MRNQSDDPMGEKPTHPYGIRNGFFCICLVKFDKEKKYIYYIYSTHYIEILHNEKRYANRDVGIPFSLIFLLV